jgi:peptidoglycan/xylan/chitin deacetylase (PgdA/CDA1 family)
MSKVLARNFIFPALVVLKYDKILLKKKAKSCCIINFHGVRASNKDVFNNRHIPSDDFEKIIIYLKNTFDIVPLHEIFDIHRTKRKMSKKTISLTFDDGYKNNFEIALPILKKHNIPATFYLISKGLIQKDFFLWPDVIDLIKKYHKDDIWINDFLFKAPYFYNDKNKIDLLNYLKTFGSNTAGEVKILLDRMSEISQKMRELSEYVALINGDEIINYINEPLIEFGSHTHSHFNLEYLDKEVAEYELKKSKEIIESKTGKKVISVAFPDGSYINETVKISICLGYTNLVAVDYKYNENNLNENLLSRFTISNSTTFESNILRLSKEFDKYGFN